MKWQLVTAFGTGAVLASGIVYLAVKPTAVVETPLPPRVASLKPPPPAPAVAAPPILPPPPKIAAALHLPVREKPSPMPPPIRRSAKPAVPPPTIVAKNEPPPPVPQPVPQPVEAVPPPPPLAPAQHVPVQNVSLPPPASSEAPGPPSVTLAAGTVLPVRIGESLSSARNQPGDGFLATLTQPLVIDGWVIAERGARLEGRVTGTTSAGRVKGVSRLEISLVRLATSDGQNIRIRTEPYVRNGASSTGADAAKIGAGAAIGAIIGALAGGGRGAGIGAGAGGAAGAGDVLLTRGKPAEIGVETRLTFRVLDPVTITEKVN